MADPLSTSAGVRSEWLGLICRNEEVTGCSGDPVEDPFDHPLEWRSEQTARRPSHIHPTGRPERTGNNPD